MWRTEKDSIWNWETHPKFPNKRDKHVPLVATPIDISGHEATPKIRMATIAKRYLGADQRRAKYVTVTARWLDGSSYCTVLVSHISSLLILLLVWLCLACLRIFLCSKKMPHLWGQYPIFLSQAHYIPQRHTDCRSLLRLESPQFYARSNFKPHQIFSYFLMVGWKSCLQKNPGAWSWSTTVHR